MTRFGIIVVQLALLVYVIHTWTIRSSAFTNLALLVLIGFPVHHLLPQRWRMPFFALLSAASIFLVAGLVNGAWIIGGALLLIGISRLPIRLAFRVGLLAACGVLFGLFHAQVLSFPWAAVWPLLASMFMFRMIVYLYDLEHKSARTGLWQTLSYFLMLPNACFPLFPVVDYKTFCRTYYNDEALQIYQSGLRWISRGVFQLLLYRLVYQYLVVDPAQIRSVADLFQAMLGYYFLYLGISGWFHLIVGILHLFGFNLPETHHRYLIATSLTDYWQRVNIYWKEFIQKIIFYPLFFRWRKLGPTRATVLAGCVAFLATWALHSYQWFWIRGAFLFSGPDMLFWGLLGTAVIITMLWQNRHPKRRGAKSGGRSLGQKLSDAAKATSLFAAMCVLWSFWAADSVDTWLNMAARATRFGSDDFLLVVAVLLLVALSSFVLGGSQRDWGDGAAQKQSPKVRARRFWQSVANVVVGGIVLLALASPRAQAMLGSSATEVLKAIRVKRLNRVDTKKLERGYYEKLDDVSAFNSQLWELYAKETKLWRTVNPPTMDTDDLRGYRLIPLGQRVVRGAVATTNRWGMRDRDYEKEKPPGVLRVAVLGASHTMGAGVEDDQTFENVLEQQWAQEEPGHSLESLNFAVGGMGPLHRLASLEVLGFSFSPDLVLYPVNNDHWVVRDAVRIVTNGVKIPYPELQAIFDRVGVKTGMSRAELERRLDPVSDEMLRFAYQQLGKTCAVHHAKLLVLRMPFTVQKEPEVIEQVADQVSMAQEVGLRVVDLTHAFDPVERLAAIRVAPWDAHPNALGHRLIADALFPYIRAELFPPKGAKQSESNDDH